ncbi:MAG: hypothetical protein ACTSPA_11455 [Promethearchaeota archaeon]
MGDTLFLIMITDGKKKKQFLGLFLLFISGILCIISEFVHWTNEFSIFQLFQLEGITNVIILNLIFYFLLELFSNQGAYLWRYLGIYMILSALLCLLFGILFQISASAENS